MIFHYLKNSFIGMRSNLMLSIQSMLSLIIGVLGVFFIVLWVHHEANTDKFHKHSDRIYLTTVQNGPMVEKDLINWELFFNFNYDEYPEIQNHTTLVKYRPEDIKFISENNVFTGAGLVADSTFFEIFDFQLSAGAKEVLASPNHLVITQAFADKVFPGEEPIGKTVTVQCDNKNTYQVAGIVERVPSNSTIQFDFIIPYHSARFWSNPSVDMLLTNDLFNPITFNKKVDSLGQNHPQFKESSLAVVPFSDVYFYHSFNKFVFEGNGDIQTIEMVMAMGMVLFLICLFNFINLQGILFHDKTKRYSIDLVLGASRHHIFRQILTDRVLLGLLAVPALLIIYHILIPPFNHLLKTNIPFFVGHQFMIMLGILISFIFLSLILSIFQLVNLSSIKIFKVDSVPFKLIGKNPLVIFQFLMTVIVLICTIGIYQQLEFMTTKDLGYDKKGVLSVKYFDRDIISGYDPPKDKEEAEQRKQAFGKLQQERRDNHQYIVDQLRKSPYILSSSKGGLPVGRIFEIPWKLSGSQDEAININNLTVEPGYQQVLDLTVLEGRFFSEDMDLSRQQKVVINEAAKKQFGISDISNASLDATYWGKDWKIIGVVKDFHFQHLSYAIDPLIIVYFHDIDNDFVIKIDERNKEESLAFLKGLYEEINPNGGFLNYTFLEDELKVQYEREKRLADLFLICTFASFLISLFGLFTLSIHESLKRTKEIGVRKVNGAKKSEIILLLNLSFTKWVVLAFLLACPIAWFIMDRWLQNFAHKTDLSWWIFAVAGLVTLSVAFLTVSWQSWKAATRNPVEALRYE